jgi:NADH-quinone oxidoreductase subunit M
VREFGGLAKVMPIYAAVFVIVTMSSIGVPGTNGFVGEFMIVMGTFTSTVLGPKHSISQGVGAAFGVVLAAVYMLSVVQKMFFGPITNEKNRGLNDLNVRETVALAPLIALIFVLGFFPNVFLSRMQPATATLLDRFEDARRTYLSMGPEAEPTLRPRRGGPFESGYPEAPSKSDAVGAEGGAQALNAAAQKKGGAQ